MTMKFEEPGYQTFRERALAAGTVCGNCKWWNYTRKQPAALAHLDQAVGTCHHSSPCSGLTLSTQRQTTIGLWFRTTADDCCADWEAL